MDIGEVKELASQSGKPSYRTLYGRTRDGEEIFSDWYKHDLGSGVEVTLCKRGTKESKELVFCMARSDEEFSVFRMRGDEWVEERPREMPEYMAEFDTDGFYGTVSLEESLYCQRLEKCRERS